MDARTFRIGVTQVPHLRGPQLPLRSSGLLAFQIHPHPGLLAAGTLAITASARQLGYQCSLSPPPFRSPGTVTICQVPRPPLSTSPPSGSSLLPDHPLPGTLQFPPLAWTLPTSFPVTAPPIRSGLALQLLARAPPSVGLTRRTSTSYRDPQATTCEKRTQSLICCLTGAL